MIIFDKALEDLSRTSDIEPKLMTDLFKGSRAELFIRVPQKSIVHSLDSSSKDPHFYDENIWVNELYDKLKRGVDRSLDSLDVYLRCFDSYKEVLQLKPEEYIKKIETEEKPREVEAIRDEVVGFNLKEQQIRESMPDSVQVGYFRVNCKDISQILAGKYSQLSRGLIEVMAKRVKQNTSALYQDIQDIQKKINEPPKDIEKLTDIKEYYTYH